MRGMYRYTLLLNYYLKRNGRKTTVPKLKDPYQYNYVQPPLKSTFQPFQ